MENNNELKYVRLKQYIISYIQNGELVHNDKIFSETELMQRFGVSRHTARKAVGELVNEGWLYTLQGKGTFVSDPSVHLKKKGKLIGVMTTYLKDYIFPEIIAGIEKILTQNDYSIILGSTNNKIEKERTCLQNMLSHDLEGLIIEPTKSVFPNTNLDLYRQFADRGIPILFIHAHYSNIPASYIEEDDREAGYMAAKHLIDLGHTQIGGLFKGDDAQGHGRYEGFVKAHRDYQISMVEDSIVWYNTEDLINLFKVDEYGEFILNRWEDCTAIVCYNDQISFRIMELLKKKGFVIPGDYAIVSFDNSNIAQKMDPKLTTVAHPKSKLGETAAKSIIELIRNEDIQIKEMMQPELIIGESTAAVKQDSSNTDL